MQSAVVPEFIRNNFLYEAKDKGTANPIHCWTEEKYWLPLASAKPSSFQSAVPLEIGMDNLTLIATP